MEKATFSLSHPQKRILYTERMYPDTPFANVAYVFWFAEAVDSSLLEKVIAWIVEHHDSLRLQVEENDGDDQVCQYVALAGQTKIDRLCMSNREEALNWAILQARTPFYIYNSPLYQFSIIELPDNRTGLFVKLHHIIGDGWSLGWLSGEITRIYGMLEQGEVPDDKDIYSYREYIAGEQEYENSEEYQRDKEYWINKYRDLPPEICLHNKKHQVAAIRSGYVKVQIPPELKKTMDKCCRVHRTTMVRLLLAVIAVYVYRVTGQGDMAMGIPFHGRQNRREKATAGMFVCTLPMRFVLSEEMDFAALVRAVTQEVSASLKHSRYPYDQLALDLRAAHGQVPDLLALNVSDYTGKDTDGVHGDEIEMGYDPSPFTIYFLNNSQGMGDGWELSALYQEELFSRDEAQRLLSRLVTLLGDALANPEKKLFELQLMSLAEQEQVLVAFNATKADYCLNTTIHELFEAQAAKNPDKPAIVFSGQQLTYQELNQKANSLATVLAAKGVKPDDIVGILVNRSLEMLIAPLAVLKAGGAYLPIDPAYPDDRIAYMLEDSGTNIVLSQQSLKEKSAGFAGQWLDVEDQGLYAAPAENRASPATPQNLVYVIYTSGSTGNPKGVLVEHQALVNLCAWQNEYHCVTAADSTALYSGFGFDACVWEIFPFFTAGATIHIIPDEIRLSPLQVNEYFETHKITIADLPTQFCEQFMEMTENTSLRRLITGGDKLKTYRLDRYKLTNEYGPTEYTISATAFDVNDRYDNIPIGKPLANTQIYILDKYQNPQPVGVPGELCIAGAQLARGYLNRPELTAEKFVPNPFSPGTRMYCTGDLACWLPDGNIEFLGRIDYQIKIRGFRIELGEIEQQIIRHEAVRDVVVIDRDDQDGNKYLCAYIVTTGELKPEELKYFLAASLPDYMIPAYIIELTALPLTANGKVDRRALPEPELTAMAAESYTAPRNQTEEKLVEIWQEILGLSRVGIDDNFFELGGHSLKAGILQAKLQKECGVRLALSEIFKLPTIRGLSSCINGQQDSKSAGMAAVATRDYYPASTAQKAIYILSQAEGVGASYHVAIANRLKGLLDVARLEKAINLVIARHEALRTVFTLIDGEIMQQIVPHMEIKLTYQQADSSRAQDNGYIMSLLTAAGMGEAFDLATPPLVRAGLIGFGDNEHLLYIEVHHIVFDGMSLELFLQETALAYEGRVLPVLALQYKDFAAWHNDFLESPAAKLQGDFWQQSLNGQLPVLQLAADYVRPAQQSFEGDHLFRFVDEALTNSLKKLAESQNASLYMVMLTAYYVLLARYTGQEDIIVATPSSGRTQADTDGMIGVFINTPPLRAYPTGNKPFSILLTEVRELVLNAMDCQDYPFHLIVEKLGIQRNVSRNPIFDTMFVLQNAGTATFNTTELHGEFYPLAINISQVDLTVEAEERNNGIALVFEFGVKLFKRETIERMAGYYLAVLNAVCQNPEIETQQVNLLSPAEERQLLIDFNQTQLAYPKDKTIHQLFEEMAEVYPDKRALVYQNTHYTYRELNLRANRLAHQLRHKGIGHDKIAAVMVERSAHLLVAALAVMKAGGAYLPIDPSYPHDRIAYMLADSQAGILLTQQHLAVKAADYQGEYLDMADERLFTVCTETSNPAAVNTSQNLAYVIYTSGSTGKPKGVMVEHRSLVNLCTWHNHYHQVTSADNAAAYSGFGFDASLWEIFPFITCGAELHILPDDIRLSPEELNRYFEAHSITITNLPTQLCEQFIELTDNHSLVTLVTGGDKLRNVKQQNYRLVNEYGPTEYTISATAFLVDKPYDNIPIGKPLANTWLYVLDRCQRLQPVGVPGELCIAGAQLARGYLHRPELTAEKFVVNPYAVGEENAVMYKTGDLVRWLPDGNIEFLGRIDEQVKIRGYRIELGEIEQQLLKYPSVKDAKVIDRSDAGGNSYLCAYVVSDSDLQRESLKVFLTKELPDYMVPSYFVQMDTIPLTANGKIDKRALPEPEVKPGLEEVYLPPRNEVEAHLVEVWQTVLNCKQVGINDNFFHLGGDSIKAIQVIARLSKYQIKLEMKDLFQYPRISELSPQVTTLIKIEDRMPVKGDTPLTPIQNWFFASNFVNPHHWNQSTLLYAANRLDPELTSKAFAKVVEHHDALRMVYQFASENICQYNRGPEEGELFQLTVIDIDIAEDGRQVAERAGEKLQQSIDLSTGPLVKLALIQQGAGSYLAIVIHHLVIDGVSWDIILEDFAAVYMGLVKGDKTELPPKTDSYKTWANRLKEYAVSRKLLRELPYWQAAEAIELRPLPVDYPQAGPSTISDEAVEKVSLSRQATAQLLTEVHKSYNTDMEDVLLAALGLAVQEWAGIDRIAVTLEGHGREAIIKDTDISRTVGWFTATYPVVIAVAGQQNIGDVLKNVKENIRRIPNKGTGYDIIRHLTPTKYKENLVYKLNPEIEFNYLGQMDDNKRDNGIFSLDAINVGNDFSLDSAVDFRLIITSAVMDGQLEISVSYSQRDYESATISRLVGCYQRQLEGLIEHCVNLAEPEPTPSDLGDISLTLDELKELQLRYGNNIQAIYPLSPMQEGMLFLSQMNPDSNAYFEQSVLAVRGDVDIALFAEHFNGIIKRYDVLRTAFVYQGVVRQVVLTERSVAVWYEDIAHLDAASCQQYIEAFQTNDRKCIFRLDTDPLIRLAVFKTGDMNYIMILGFHHIIMDGWGMGIIARELFYYYSPQAASSLALKQPPPYRNYIEWLRKQDKDEAKEYWRQYLSGCENRTVLPQGKPLNSTAAYQPQDHKLMLDRQLTARLQEIAQDNQVTLNSIIQAVWGLLLQRYNNHHDVVFGAVVSGRTPEVKGIEDMVGLFINTIPIRVESEQDVPFNKLVKRLQAAWLASESYSYLPLAEIQAETNLKDALISHLVAFQNVPDPSEDSAALQAEEIGGFDQINYSFGLVVVPGEEIHIRISYNANVYTEKMIGDLAGHLFAVIQAVAANPAIMVHSIDILSSSQQIMLLNTFNDTSLELPAAKTVHQLFEEMARRYPDNGALVFKEQSYTYAQLNANVNQLARLLREKGVKPDSTVAIMVERGPGIIVGSMAVMKAGGAYVPIDPAYPQERIEYMLNDCGAILLLTQASLMEKIGTYQGEYLDVYDTELYNGSKSSSNLEPVALGSHLAYIIYTSGSTGKPKGVMVEHHSLINLCVWHQQYHQVTAEDKGAAYSGFGFDASIWEMYPFLTCGAELHIIPEEIRLSPVDINRYFENHGITVTNLPTQFCEQFMEMTDNQSLKTLVTGGDKLKYYRPQRYRLVNEYGPTEYTISATAFLVNNDYDNIPIGKPLANTWLYVLDLHQRLQPVGVPGELCIAGEQLARGYRNRDDLTAEKFVDNPFATGSNNARMYKTGDLVRWLPDGNLEFLGRIDQQVKIRGYRIELGEIEQRLRKHPQIKDNVVIDRDDAVGNKYLCAYYVADTGVTPKELKEYLAIELPEYMIPLYFIALSQIPITANGKVDKRSLPIPAQTGARQYVAPGNDIEVKMAQIWQEVLGVTRVGVEENFFALGGHSLKVTLLIAKIQKAFAITLPYSEIFAKPTVKELCQAIAAMTKGHAQEITAVEKREYYPLASKQKRIYIMEQMEGIGAAYHITSAFILKGEMDKERLSQAIDRLIARHDSLRTAIVTVDGQLLQQVYDKVHLKRSRRQAQWAEVGGLLEQFVRRFDLSRPPLLRIELLEIGLKEHVLFFDVHHIVFDGISMQVFINELLELYEGQELPPVKLQYGDFALWEETRLKSPEINAQEEYWLSVFAGELPVLNLPCDFPRPAVRSYDGEVASFTVDAKLASKLQALAEQHQATLFMVILAAYSVLLHKYTGQEDVIVGTPSSGRINADLEEVIGMFVSTLPCRLYPAADKNFAQLLAEVRESSLQALNNQEYPFEGLLDKLNIRRDPSRNPLFDTMFSYNAKADSPAQGSQSGLSIYPYEADGKVAQFDLTLDATEEGEEILLAFEYCTKLFTAQTIENMGNHFIAILHAISEESTILLKTVDMLSTQEKQQLLHNFNTTTSFYSSYRTVQDLFDQAVKKYPDKPALVFKNKTYTYLELDRQTNQLARLLRSKGLGRDERAAIMVNRSADIIVGILAVLKAGGCYVPIDPGYATERIGYMLSDSGAKLLLSQLSLKAKAQQFAGEWLDLGDDTLYTCDASRLDNINNPEDLAYVIYTSGSTGNPKGVMLEHHNLINLCQWHHQYHAVTAADSGAAYSGFGFDASVWETIPFITCGATLHIIPEELRLSPLALNEYFEEHHITITNLPTQFCEQFMELTDNQSLRTLVTGGDKLKSYRKRQYKLVNEYGPTECTVSATVFEVDKEYNNIPIGKPLANTWLYVVDRYNQLQPVGVGGELCIAGTQVARGYLNRPELTDEKFVVNPFAVSHKNERMYRTGDLVRWLPDGNLEFLGRIDQQVKIRGYRIELGEIEQQILRHPQTRDTVVLAYAAPDGSDFLAAYYVLQQPGLTSDKLKEFLLSYLPEYMLPAYFIEVNEIPLTANGKIDRRALPQPDYRASDEEMRAAYRAASTFKEEKILKVWHQVLGIEDIGVQDNFFQLGGNSIKAITLVAKLQAYFDITINHIFEHQTIAALAENIKDKQNHLQAKLAELKERFAQQSAAEPGDVSEEIWAAEEAAYRRNNERYQCLDVSAVNRYDGILLTGATGYLGIHVLRELLEATDSRLYLLLRGENEQEIRGRLLQKIKYYFGEEFAQQASSDRLVILSSQLQEENLGLDTRTYAELAEKAACIIHTAANVRHYGHYDEFWNSNVGTTLNLLTLAKQGIPKAFHHISTISVGEGNIPGCQAAVFSEYQMDMGQELSNYYLKTKLEAEKAVAAARAEGVNASIYRVGNIVFQSDTGVYQENIEENAFYLQVKAFVNLGVMPTGYEAEFSFVNQLAKAIVRLASCAALRQETYHLYNSHIVNLDEVLTDAALGLKVKGLPYEQFIDYLAIHYDKPGFQKHIEQVMLHFGWLDDTGEGGDSSAGQTEFLILADKTTDLLKRLGFEWAALTPAAMKKMLERALTERIEFIRQVPVFETISATEAARIAGQSAMCLYGDETSILWEGEQNDNLYLIMDGFAEISRQSAGGWHGTLRVAGVYDFVGEESLIGEQTAAVTAEAVLGDAVVLAVPAQLLTELIQSSPQMALGVIKAMNSRLRKLEKLVVSMG